jgi:hypothetical protein
MLPLNRFALCSTCVEVQEEWHKAKSDGEKKLWKQAKEQHHNDVRFLFSVPASSSKWQ